MYKQWNAIEPGDLVQVGGSLTTWERVERVDITDPAQEQDPGPRIELQPVLVGPGFSDPKPCGRPRSLALPRSLRVQVRTRPAELAQENQAAR